MRFHRVDEAAEIIKENIPKLKDLLETADKISKRSLKISYIAIGISVLAVILAIIPLLPKN
jgi:lipopolysaccharide/colanic/teichoic acid biosynthesis glycosyltransferase